MALLLVAPLLTGCTALNGAKDQVDKLKQEAQDLKAQAEAAKARYDRVRSLTVIRTEKVDLVLTPLARDGVLSFSANATRDGIRLPPENLTRLPTLDAALDPAQAPFASCDPLSCRLRYDGGIVLRWTGDATWGWRVQADGNVTSVGALGPIEKKDASVLATVSAGGVTD